MNTVSIHPPDYEALRALLHRIKISIAAKDYNALIDYYTITKNLSFELELDEQFQAYIYGSYENVKEDIGEGESYRLHTKSDVADAYSALEKIAFGTFTEAMSNLEYDIGSFSTADKQYSDEFNSKYFDKEDRKIWDELRLVLKKYSGTHSEEAKQKCDEAILKLRSYMQKYYGQLIPVMNAAYRKEQYGFSIRLAWINECLHVQTHSPLYEDIDNYFTVEKPIESRLFFVSNAFPKSIKEFTLENVSYENLFEYELD